MINYDPHRWLDHFFDIRGSMVKEILGRVALCVLWSAGVVAAYKHGFQVAIPSMLHSLVGLALGLLLVFRTNASYDRFWEGRKLWGGIVNESRNLIRAARAFLPVGNDVLLPLARWTAAFPYASMNYLRGAPGIGAAAQDLAPLDVEQVQRAGHPPLAVAVRMGQCVADARGRGLIGEYTHVALDQNIQLLVDYVGGCERIRKTPLPFAYVVHLRRALVIYCFTLPFALVETFGWITVLDVFLVSYVFFGIEEIGVEIEGPFGYDDNDLPLEQISDTIRRNVLELAGAGAEVRQNGEPGGELGEAL